MLTNNKITVQSSDVNLTQPHSVIVAAGARTDLPHPKFWAVRKLSQKTNPYLAEFYGQN